MRHIKPVALLLLTLLICSFTMQAAEWVDFVSKEGNFKIKMPKLPEENTQDVQVGDLSLKMHLYVYDASNDSGDNMLYYVMYCDYPKGLVNTDMNAEILDTFFKNSIEGGAKNMNGVVQSVSEVKYKGFPGRVAKINIMDGQAIGHMELYLVHNRLYIFMCACDPKKDNNASTAKFCSSFELLDNNFTQPDGPTAAIKWQEMEYKDAGFKIKFPGKPEKTEKDLKTAVGPCKMTMYVYESTGSADENNIYGIGYTVYPKNKISSNLNEKIVDSLLQLSVMGSAKKIKGEIIFEENITYNDYRGKHAKISFADGEGIMNEKVYLVGNRSYILEVGYEKSNDNNDKINEFFGSFNLLKGEKEKQ